MGAVKRSYAKNIGVINLLLFVADFQARYSMRRCACGSIIVNAERQDGRPYYYIEANLIEQWLVLYGSAYEWNRGDRDGPLAEARHALLRWRDLGLTSSCGEEGGQSFDPVEVLKFAKAVARAGRDSFWYDRLVKTSRKLVCEFHDAELSTAAPPPPPTSLPPRKFQIRLSREFNLDGIDVGRRLLLRLPVPLEDRSLRDLSIGAALSTAETACFCRAGGGLEWRLTAGSEPSIAISADYSFVANPACGDPQADRPTAEIVDLYTRPKEGLVAVTTRIADLAKRIAGKEPDRLVKVERIWNFILDEFALGQVHYDQIGASNPSEWVLDNGAFDCHLGSILFVTLCRSLGIPARLVGGYVLYSVAPVPHFWAEVLIGGRGWLPVDFSCWDLSAGGRDRAWRNYFFGALDYRCKTEILPRYFTGLSTIRLGSTWLMLSLPIAGGTEIRFLSTITGKLICRDRITILPLPTFVTARPHG